MVRFVLLLCLAIFIASCTASSKPEMVTLSYDPAELLGPTWRWEKTVTPVETISVASPERYTIHFAENGRLQAQFDCNGGGGSYMLSEGKVSFGPILSTRMACPEDSQDVVFMRDLQRVNSFFLADEILFLELPYDSATMRFRAVP